MLIFIYSIQKKNVRKSFDFSERKTWIIFFFYYIIKREKIFNYQADVKKNIDNFKYHTTIIYRIFQFRLMVSKRVIAHSKYFFSFKLRATQNRNISLRNLFLNEKRLSTNYVLSLQLMSAAITYICGRPYAITFCLLRMRRHI